MRERRDVSCVECPACHHELSPVETGGVSMDVCKDGCGAIWCSCMELQIAAAHAVTDDRLARAHRVANLFRFICPSYYIPGEQQLDAF